MPIWPRYPTLYEINTWVWLSDLSQKCGNSVNLSSVPSAEWDAIAKDGFDGVWLMGIWERSPAGIAITNRNITLLNDFRRALPDFRLEDNIGSPYCVRRYVADKHFAGPEGLAIARKELAKRGMKLILDFVPNHVGLDHRWVAERPDLFVQSPVEAPGTFAQRLCARFNPGQRLTSKSTMSSSTRSPWPKSSKRCAPRCPDPRRRVSGR